MSASGPRSRNENGARPVFFNKKNIRRFTDLHYGTFGAMRGHLRTFGGQLGDIRGHFGEIWGEIWRIFGVHLETFGGHGFIGKNAHFSHFMCVFRIFMHNSHISG